tara:strand:- start:506 stop:718 length:213 start_codon:yes stop_codon:yes gene_type:complete
MIMEYRKWTINAIIEAEVEFSVEARCESDAYDEFKKAMKNSDYDVIDEKIILLDDSITVKDIEPDYERSE